MVDAREYHERTTHTPRELREGDFSLDPRTKPRPYKVYQDLPRVELPSIRPPQVPALAAVSESDADPLTDAADHLEGFDREALATLCYEASGVVREMTTADGREMAFRAASCTGKLYHVDLYAVCGDLPDLAAGVYHFDPSTMALDVLREGEFRGALAEAAGGGGDSTGVADAPVTFVATSTWWRNAWKYRERTYRHAFWDSGTVLANLLGAAHATDRRAEVVAAFADDPIAELVGVDPGEEAPIALAPVGSGDPAPDPRPVELIDPATEPLSADREEYPLIGEAREASILADGAAARDWRERVQNAVGSRGFGGRASDGEKDGERIDLEPVDSHTASARPLHATIRRRGSCREYAREGPTRRQVGTILDRATRGVPADWNGGAADGLAFNDLHVLATGVSGIPDGSYRYLPEVDALERVGEIDREEKTRLALDQAWAGDAHLNVYLLADVEGIVEAFGNRGYRLAQLEAGLALGRLYLATYAHRNLGGLGLTFYDDLVSDALTEGERTPTCLYVFGRRGD